MSDATVVQRMHFKRLLQAGWKERIWIFCLCLLGIISLFDHGLAKESLAFSSNALLHTAPYLLFSIAIAASASATGADNLIASAFKGAPVIMIGFAAVAGGVSPFCSCGVIPLIAALLAMGVPLSAVMAFWLASPVMDPSMFILTSGVLGFEFAVAKTFAAIGLGLFGGFSIHLLSRFGGFNDPLRDGVGNGGCGGAKVRTPKQVFWKFWKDSVRLEKFFKEALKNTNFLAKWLFLAFILESLMLQFVPAERISALLGGEGIGPIVTATVVGVPAYLNGYAALPLISGLIDQGMAPGAGLAFLVAGGVTSIPAAIAVWALARWPVFFAYVLFSLTGAFLSGIIFQIWLQI